MKALILLPAGIADVPVSALGDRTPLEEARTPHLDAVAREGRLGLVRPVPPGRPIASDVAVLSALGYDPRRERVTRGALEAAALGVDLGPGDVAFRMNFVSTFRDHLVDLSAGRIGDEDGRMLVDALSAELGGGRFSFHAGLGYRNLLVVRDGAELDIRTVPPSWVQGHPLTDGLPTGRDAHVLVELMDAARHVLANHDVNRVRVDLRENPADAIWPWGPGTRDVVEPFALRTRRSLSVVAAVPLVRGLAQLAGATVPDVPGATGSWDTDYDAKARCALEQLEHHDVVLVHVAAANEACHEADVRLKVRAIEDIDRRLVGPLRQALLQRRDARMMVTTDHRTSALAGEIAVGSPDAPPMPGDVEDWVPFALWAPGRAGPDDVRFTEADAARGGFAVEEGHALLEFFLRSAWDRPSAPVEVPTGADRG